MLRIALSKHNILGKEKRDNILMQRIALIVIKGEGAAKREIFCPFVDGLSHLAERKIKFRFS